MGLKLSIDRYMDLPLFFSIRAETIRPEWSERFSTPQTEPPSSLSLDRDHIASPSSTPPLLLLLLNSTDLHTISDAWQIGLRMEAAVSQLVGWSDPASFCLWHIRPKSMRAVVVSMMLFAAQ